MEFWAVSSSDLMISPFLAAVFCLLLSTLAFPQGTGVLSLHSDLYFSQFMSLAHDFSNPVEAFSMLVSEFETNLH